MTFCHQAALMTNSCDPTIETCDNKGQVLEKKSLLLKSLVLSGKINNVDKWRYKFFCGLSQRWQRSFININNNNNKMTITSIPSNKSDNIFRDRKGMRLLTACLQKLIEIPWRITGATEILSKSFRKHLENIHAIVSARNWRIRPFCHKNIRIWRWILT